MIFPAMAPLSLPEIGALLSFLYIALIGFVLCWILAIKKEPLSALAWCLTVIFVPLFGMIFFWLFGYQNVQRPLSRKRRHTQAYRRHDPRRESKESPDVSDRPPHGDWEGLVRYATALDAFPATDHNSVTFYWDSPPLFEAVMEAIDHAEHHIHIQTFIFRSDTTGTRLMNRLAEKAKQGVEVRLIYDAVGAHDLSRKMLRQLRRAGGKASSFLSILNPLRRFQINLRNHRKLVIVDGRVGFVGGQNFGDEYLGLSKTYGYWRDTHLKLEGPSVAHLQRVFLEDWDFAEDERLKADAYFPEPIHAGRVRVQVIESGPDRELKGIREVLFAAIQRARHRVWIATPYFVPDAGLRDALLLAGRYGLDVRILGPFRPDKWIPYLASRYYWDEMLDAGVKVYQYTKGFMHSKMVLIDEDWATVGTANFDNRSLHLNFEVNCLFYSPETVAQLEEAFLRDFAVSIRLNPEVFAERPLLSRLAENACRLLSPVL